jgi:hypothetical protein
MEPITLEDFLVRTRVDMKKWAVSNHYLSQWTLASGAPAYQIKVWFELCASSVECPKPITFKVCRQPHGRAQTPSPRRAEGSTSEASVVIPDSQNGYWRDLRTGKLEPMHDRRAWDLCLQVIRHTQPTRVILLGDMVDATEFTIKYRRAPEHFFTFQPTMLELGFWLKAIREVAPHAEVIYLEGNHERRLYDMAATVALPYTHLLSPFNLDAKLLSIPGMIDLQKLGVTYIGDYPNGIYWITPKLAVFHGDTSKPKGPQTVQKVLEDVRHSFIMGHVHRVEHAARTLHAHDGQEIYAGWSPGCICRLNGAVPGVKARQNWQNGLGMVRSDRISGRFDVQLHHIINGTTYFEGELLVGLDRTDEIRQTTGWESL